MPWICGFVSKPVLGLVLPTILGFKHLASLDIKEINLEIIKGGCLCYLKGFWSVLIYLLELCISLTGFIDISLFITNSLLYLLKCPCSPMELNSPSNDK